MKMSKPNASIKNKIFREDIEEKHLPKSHEIEYNPNNDKEKMAYEIAGLFSKLKL
jgi:hypothetical protein